MAAQSSSNHSVSDERELVLEAVLGPASEAYYSERVRSGSGARLRAQAAQSTVTLFAGGIVAALTFTQLDDRPEITRWVGVAAVALWLLAAVMYLRAVAQPVSALAGPSHARDRLDLLNAVLKRADDEATQIDRRQRHANRVVITALIASLGTIVLATVLGAEEKTISGSVLLSPSYATTVRSLCDLTGDRIAGRIDEASLSASFVRVTVTGKSCGGKTGEVELAVPRAAIRAITMERD
ncbi:hypothetical protein [Streptomyces sp. TUS-ST3]|uniref:hypothetical protein n=1 Tax=Streptomyces sp. TUS-ST3 TaxID=3025591 RepID=UPI0024E061B2|nr:hypothetical protein [Streptomyces sp. TUS-ST3]